MVPKIQGLLGKKKKQKDYKTQRIRKSAVRLLIPRNDRAARPTIS